MIRRTLLVLVMVAVTVTLIWLNAPEAGLPVLVLLAAMGGGLTVLTALRDRAPISVLRGLVIGVAAICVLGFVVTVSGSSFQAPSGAFLGGGFGVIAAWPNLRSAPAPGSEPEGSPR